MTPEYEASLGAQMLAMARSEGHSPMQIKNTKVCQKDPNSVVMRTLAMIQGKPPMTGREITDLVGAKRDTVSSALSLLRARGHVEYNKSNGRWVPK